MVYTEAAELIACIDENDELTYFLLECMKPDQIFSVKNLDNHSILCNTLRYGLDHLKNQNTLLETLSELDQDCSVVYDAIEYGHEHVALSPLESGGKSDGIDATGRNALHWAAQHGLIKVVEYLASYDKEFKIKLGKINASGNSPLNCAFCSVSMALKPNLRIWTPKVGTALHWAAWYDRLDVVKLLVTNRAVVEEKDALGLRAADIVKKK
ncbi:hypothetical protein ACHAO1_007829 [Botrytis cinerea]